MICRNCGQVYDSSGLYCPACGAKRPSDGAICSNCGNVNPPGEMFCGECGLILQPYAGGAPSAHGTGPGTAGGPPQGTATPLAPGQVRGTSPSQPSQPPGPGAAPPQPPPGNQFRPGQGAVAPPAVSPQPGPQYRVSQQGPLQAPPPHVINPPTSGKATAALVLGICGLVVCPLVCSVLAIVFGVMAKNEIAASRGAIGGQSYAQAGYILGIVGAVLGVLYFIAFAMSYESWGAACALITLVA